MPAAKLYLQARYEPIFFPLVFALATHVVLFFILFVGLQWHSRTPSGIEAEIWTQLPSSFEPAVSSPEETTPITAPITPAIPAQADIVLPETKKRTLPTHVTPQSTPLVSEKKPKDTVDTKHSFSSAQQAMQRLQKLQTEQARAAQLARLRSVANAVGSGGSTGSASGNGRAGVATYADAVRQKVRPNIIFDDERVNGNPAAVIAVELSPDGALLSKRLVTASGNLAWDAAVLLALERSVPLPRDVDGKVPPRLTITFRVRD